MNCPLSSDSPAAGRHITKAELAKLLHVTPRTIQNYVASGALPAPDVQGRTVVWSIASLSQFLNDNAVVGSLSQAAREGLRESLSTLSFAESPNGSQGTSKGNEIAAGYLVDVEADVDFDWRPRIYEVNALTRAAAREFHEDALDHPRGSEEGRRLFELAQRNRDAVDLNEHRLKADFIPAHGAGQLLGTRELLNHPLFAICNARSPREATRDMTFKLPDGKTMRYTGPELRQDDALVFEAMLRVASDARTGRLVAFVPADLCWTLFNDYCGSRRDQLKDTIKRLQSAKLTFEEFSVHLIGRFDFPKYGRWSVALDRDVVRLFADGRQVWMNLDKVLDYGNGIAGWAYRYICAQTTLIPRKTDHLRRLSGSTATLDSFRSNLKEALFKLVVGGDIDRNWRIDQHDMLHWKKPARPQSAAAKECLA